MLSAVAVIVAAILASPGIARAVELGQAQEVADKGQGKFWILTIVLLAAALVCAIAFLIVGRRTIPPARQPYVPPDIPLPGETERPVVRRRSTDAPSGAG